ncbi:MAG: hypothetical protein KDJ43_13100, partial [Rhizobiaceae bacterium]|nr:hypothetical protein [Rhizobiaceae bacterium]
MRQFLAAIFGHCGSLVAFGLAAGLVLAAPTASLALSEIPEEDVEPSPEIITVPLPPPIAGPGQ